jgi:hypothetical protein
MKKQDYYKHGPYRLATDSITDKQHQYRQLNEPTT